MYKKKRSRSLAFGGTNEESQEKKSKISAEIWHKRIKDMSEDINSINMSMALLEKERYKQHNMNKYAQAASLEEQISSKRKEKRVLEAELTMLQEKKVKSKRYHMSKESKDKKEAWWHVISGRAEGCVRLGVLGDVDVLLFPASTGVFLPRPLPWELWTFRGSS